MRGCRAACAHRAFVRQYQAERMRQELVADEASAGYETEFDAYVDERPLVTFKSWLIDHAAPSPEDLTIEPTHDDWKPPAGF
jgi:hypothetical protein